MCGMMSGEYIDYAVNTYGDMVYRLAISRTRKKEDAEDIFQEVFLKLSKKMPEFESQIHEKAWLIRVTINTAKNVVSSGWFKNVVALDQEIKFEEKEKEDVYYEVLNLPAKYRTIIHLFYYERLTIKEIAQIVGLNENTVKTRLARAKERLKVKLEGGFDNEG